MRTTRWMSLAAMCVVLLGLLAVWGSVSPGQAPAAKPGVVWEYKTYFHGGGDPEANLNELGQKGWELAGVSAGFRNEHLFVFKRPKP